MALHEIVHCQRRQDKVQGLSIKHINVNITMTHKVCQATMYCEARWHMLAYNLAR